MRKRLLIIIIFLSIIIISPTVRASDNQSLKIRSTKEINLDSEGTAHVTSNENLLSESLADYVRILVNGGDMQGIYVEGIGSERYKFQLFASVTETWAERGLEAENLQFSIIGLDNSKTLSVNLSYELPYFGVRENNENWIIHHPYIDPLESLQDQLAELRQQQLILQVIQEGSVLQINSETKLLLPENSEFLSFEGINPPDSQTIDYGNGNYESITWGTENNILLIENSRTVLQNPTQEITISAQDLKDQRKEEKIHYKNPESPEETGIFTEFTKPARKYSTYIKYGGKLPSEFSINYNGKKFSLTPPQFLYYSSKTLVKINENDNTKIMNSEPITVEAPESDNGDWKTIWNNLSREEIISLASNIINEIDSFQTAPSEFQTSKGRIRYRDAIFLMTRALDHYHVEKEIPQELMIYPVSQGEFSNTWRETTHPIPFSLIGIVWVGSIALIGLTLIKKRENRFQIISILL
ncbi:MAG: hypothetical protein KGY45_02130, partial [Hadesarchaea archaeon]|nr:hypothetical protein [Hadesarchaea archaeon]